MYLQNNSNIYLIYVPYININITPFSICDILHSGKQQLNWWIKAWQFSGLDEPAEAFDIVVMAHPSVVADIADQCTLVTPQFSAKFNGTGKCFYKPYIGWTFIDQREN